MRHHSGSLLAQKLSIGQLSIGERHIAAAIYYGSHLCGTQLFVFGHASIRTVILDAVESFYLTVVQRGDY